MTTPTTLSAADLRAVMATYAALLRSHREVINRLNVYPVPDGDTGTNMTLTVESVVAALADLGPTATLTEVGQAIAHGSLMGARGNSGVILSQLLRGLVERWRAEGVDPSELAIAFAHADDLARLAVERPVEGTILTVARAAAEGARDVEGLVDLVRAARASAHEALDAHPRPAARPHAGRRRRRGRRRPVSCCSTRSATSWPATRCPSAPSVDRRSTSTRRPRRPARSRSARATRSCTSSRRPTSAIGAFSEVWAGLGDSIVVVGGDGLYNCHIHTDDVGARDRGGARRRAARAGSA